MSTTDHESISSHHGQDTPALADIDDQSSAMKKDESRSYLDGPKLFDVPNPDNPSEVRYTFVKEIGKGGLGHVYEVYDHSLARIIAAKKLNPKVVNDTNFSALRRSITPEAQSVAMLNHPNIARVYSYIIHNNEEYAIFEYIKGKTVTDLLKENYELFPKDDPDRFSRICLQLADAMDYIHLEGKYTRDRSQGVIGRKKILYGDLKPANIMITPEGEVKMLDFGTAAIELDTSSNSYANAEFENEPIGTVSYMSLDRLRGGKNLTTKSDLYEYGIFIFELLTGKALFPRVWQGEEIKDPNELGRLRALGTIGFQNLEILSILFTEPEASELKALFLEVLDPIPENRPKNTTEFALQLNEIVTPSIEKTPLQILLAELEKMPLLKRETTPSQSEAKVGIFEKIKRGLPFWRK